MKGKSRRWTSLTLAALIAVTSACGMAGNQSGKGIGQNVQPKLLDQNKNGQNNANNGSALNGQANMGDGQFSLFSLPGAEAGRLPVATIDGKQYVSALKLAELLDFQTEWDNGTGTLGMGPIDSEYVLKNGSNQAEKEEESVSLAEAPILHEGELHIPISALADLFGEEITYQLSNGQLNLAPNLEALSFGQIDDPEDPPETNDELSFADDPNDPFKDVPASVFLSHLLSGDGTVDPEAVPALKNIDMNALISTAKRYIGVDYKFVAKPYAQSGRFDCSSFVRHVFAKQGVELPRLARNQAKRGTLVSRKNLRKGDLLFFYVPGRFRSNKIVGHVGIYIGNNKMIHSYPAPRNGVQIDSINKAYWKKTFLRAKRVAT